MIVRQLIPHVIKLVVFIISMPGYDLVC